MNIETRKVDLISWIANIHNKRLIDRLEQFRDTEDDWWDGLQKHTQDEILESEKQANSGRLISHENVMQKHKKHL